MQAQTARELLATHIRENNLKNTRQPRDAILEAPRHRGPHVHRRAPGSGPVGPAGRRLCDGVSDPEAVCGGRGGVRAALWGRACACTSPPNWVIIMTTSSAPFADASSSLRTSSSKTGRKRWRSHSDSSSPTTG